RGAEYNRRRLGRRPNPDRLEHGDGKAEKEPAGSKEVGDLQPPAAPQAEQADEFGPGVIPGSGCAFNQEGADEDDGRGEAARDQQLLLREGRGRTVRPLIDRCTTERSGT